MGGCGWAVVQTRREGKKKPLAVPWSATLCCARLFFFSHNSKYRLAQRKPVCLMYESNVSFSPLWRNREPASSVE